MIVSAETLAVLCSAVTILIAMFAGFGWVISRMDKKFAELDPRIARVEHELSEVKIAIARLEGPTPRLITAR